MVFYLNFNRTLCEQQWRPCPTGIYLTIYVTGETTNIVATCGGKLVCLIDCHTGLFLNIYVTGETINIVAACGGKLV